MKNYDVAIPLGIFCAASYHLRRNNLQIESYPFDWMGFATVKTGAQIVADGCKDFFVKERLVKEEGENGNHIPYVQEPEKYLFYHCVDKDLPFDEACAKAKAMFDRRIKRMYDNIEKAKRVLFFSTHNHPVSEQEAIDAQAILAKRFPGKIIDLIVVDCRNDYKGIETLHLNDHVDFVKLEFHHGTDTYSDRKEEFDLILKNCRLGSPWQRFVKHFNNVIFRLKRFAVNGICCLIPVKKWRKAIRRRFDVSTQMFERK